MKTMITALAVLLCATTLDAQVGRGGRASNPPTGATPPVAAPGQGGRGGRASTMAPKAASDQYSQYLYAPEVVMRNQQSISLQEVQRTRIITEMSQAQAKFTEIQWTLSGEEEKLTILLRVPAPGEQAVLAQMDRILSLEQSLKRTQMLLLVRVKNILTPEQQTILSRLQPTAAPMSRPAGVGMPIKAAPARRDTSGSPTPPSAAAGPAGAVRLAPIRRDTSDAQTGRGG